MNQKEFIAFLGRLCEAVGSQAEIARRAGISPQKLNDVLSNRRDPPEHLLRALSFKKEYVRDFTGRMLIQNKILEVSFDLKDKNWVMTYGGQILHFGDDGVRMLEKAAAKFGWTISDFQYRSLKELVNGIVREYWHNQER